MWNIFKFSEFSPAITPVFKLTYFFPEIIIICWFGAQAFIIINAENRYDD